MATQADSAARIAHPERQLASLEHRLALAQQLVRDRTGLDLGAMLDAAHREGEQGTSRAASAQQAAATRTAPPLPPSAAAQPPTDSDPAPPAAEQDAQIDAPPPVDVGPFVLRALALRKRIHLGDTSEADAEAELRDLFEGEAAALSEEQRASVRQWAGL
ncbi:hypothetical protein JCM8208_006252 [Rhodotorula glutinis]